MVRMVRSREDEIGKGATGASSSALSARTRDRDKKGDSDRVEVVEDPWRGRFRAGPADDSFRPR